MDKPNIAFAVLSAILGTYIAAALLLSRLRGPRTPRPRAAAARRNRSWTSYLS